MKNLVIIFTILCLFIVLPMGCGDDDAAVCQDGSTAPCACEGGFVGLQVCEDGQWLECDCTGGTDTDTDTDTDSDTDDTPGNSAPAVSVSANPLSGTAPLTVAFNATVAGGDGALTYAWDFGDGNTGTEEDPSHDYASGGAFTASLVVTDEDGDQGMDSVTIEVASNDAPSVEITATPAAGLEPLLVEFDAEVVGGNAPFTYEWDFDDDAVVDSIIANPNFTFEDGVFEVTVTVTDADGDTATDTESVLVAAVNEEPQPIGEILAGECAVPNVTRVELNAIPSEDMDDEVTFEWVFVTVPEGSDVVFDNPTIANPWFIPDLEGEYTFRVFVADSIHAMGSELLTVIASEVPGATEVVSGAGQEAHVGEDFELPMVARVLNTCGAALPGAMVRLYGHNARVHGDVRQPGGIYFADEEGLVTFWGQAGPRPGDGTAIVNALCYEAVFEHNVLVGDSRYIVMEDFTGHPTVSDTEGVTLSFQLTDEFLNPVTGPKTQFDVNVDSGSACFEAPAVGDDDDDDVICESQWRQNLVTDADGRATVKLRSVTTNSLWISFFDVEIIEGERIGTKLSGLARKQWKEDFESDPTWMVMGQWEHGSPAAGVGPSAAHSGTNLMGTNLAGNYTINDDYYYYYYGEEGEPDALVWPILTEKVFSDLFWYNPPTTMYVDFWHWYDTIGDTCPECVAGSGLVGWQFGPLTPWGGYPGPELCFDEDEIKGRGDGDRGAYPWGFAGKSNGWKLATMMYGSYPGRDFPPDDDDDDDDDSDSDYFTNYIAFFFGTSPFGEPDGAGWYVDDVELNAVWTRGFVKFEAASPDYVSIWQWTEGGIAQDAEDGEVEPVDGGPDSGCASYGENAIIEIATYDEFGNFVDRPDIAVNCAIEDDPPPEPERLHNDSATFVSPAYEGTLTEGANTVNAKATTSDDGLIYLGIQNTEQEPISVDCDLDAITDDEPSSAGIWFNSDHFPPGDCCYNPIVMDMWEPDQHYAWGNTLDPYYGDDDDDDCAPLDEYHALIPEEEIMCSNEMNRDLVFKVVNVPVDGLYYINVDGYPADDDDDDDDEMDVNVYQGDVCPGEPLPEGSINGECFEQEFWSWDNNAGDDIWAYLRKDTTYWIVVRASDDQIYDRFCVEAYVGYEWTDEPQGSGS